MRGNHDSGIAIESSIAAPKLILLSPLLNTIPPLNMIKLKIIVIKNNADIAIAFNLPKFLTPISIHTKISPPITIHHIKCPIGSIP